MMCKSPIKLFFVGALVATVLLSEILVAGPVTPRSKADESMRMKAEAAASARRLVRNRRNISWYKQHSDFWNWYKYFTDAGNTDAVQELDRVYLSYLQNKNRAEGRRSYKAYLQHLGEIYKSCADTEDPSKCVASYTSRPKPEPPKPAPLKVCDPYKDPYCLYGLYSPYVAPVAAKAPAPAAVKAPAYINTAHILDPRTGHYYYTPVMEPFLSAEQKAELLRICNAEDVECLQYHLRASYGYRPTGGALPSYAHLGCDPKSDPHCLALLMRHTPSGLHLPYRYCNPTTDPYCAYAAALHAQQGEAQAASSLKMPCNPLFDDKCNPLTTYKLATESEDVKDEPASAALRAAPRAAPAAAAARQDPYAMFRDAAAAAMQRRAPAHPYRLPVPPRFQMPTRHYQPPTHRDPEPQEERHPLGPRGKTKEGYDCFIGYDEECYPLKPAQNEPRSSPHRQIPYQAEAYEPHVKADGSRNGVVEPDPDCDPEYDANCKLRRYEPEAAEPSSPQEEVHPAYPAREHEEQPNHRDDVSQHHQENPYPEQHPEVPGYNQDPYDPYQSGQEDPYTGYSPQDHGSPNFQDMLRGYGDHFGQDDHRAYTGDYKK